MGTRETFVYVTYIRTTPERLWQALTDPDISADYWGARNVSDWRAGSKWEHRALARDGAADGTLILSGTVLESDPPRRLVNTWVFPDSREPQSRVTFEIDSVGEAVRLRVTHEDLEAAAVEGWQQGWAAVLSSLKSLMETGRPLRGLS